jgi:hypothetical protein
VRRSWLLCVCEDGRGSGCLYGGVALAPGPALKRLGGLLRPMFLIGPDPVLQGWWLLRLVNALWLGFLQRQRVDRLLVFFFSDGDEGCACLIVAVMAVCSSTTVCILLVYYCLYMYQLCIVMNISNVCPVGVYRKKKSKIITSLNMIF